MGSAQRVQIRLSGAGGSHDLSLKLEFLKHPAVSQPTANVPLVSYAEKGSIFLYFFSYPFTWVLTKAESSNNNQSQSFLLKTQACYMI